MNDIIIVLLLITIVVASYFIESSDKKVIDDQYKLITSQKEAIEMFKYNIHELNTEYNAHIDVLSDLNVANEEVINQLEKQLVQSVRERELLIKKLLEVGKND